MQATCLATLLTASLSLCAANEASQVLDSDLKTWNRLKRDAGYYTESGLWRGGLYRSARWTETPQYHCLTYTATHCTSWNVSERRPKKHMTGTCECEETASPFCQQWTCDTRFKYECGDSHGPKTCLDKESRTCNCAVQARNERYCWEWHCRKDTNTKPGGYHEFEDYMCVVGDLTAEYCYRWTGNTTSKYVAESSACECFERGRGFCEYWRCRERGILRCEQSERGWCRLEIAIGVGGGMGLFFFSISLVLWQTALADPIDGQLKLEVTHVVLCFVVFCLPWTAGVVIWGGIFGFPGVFFVWAITLGAMIYVVKREERKRNGQSFELPRIQLPRIQVPKIQMRMPTATATKSIDDSQSDKANDV